MGDLGQRRILLVEDEAILAMTEILELQDIGYKVFHAMSGEQAIDFINMGKEKIDLILMDIDLGSGIDGTEAAKEILKTHDIPVLFLSSHIEKDIVEKTEKITSYGYVVKNSGIIVIDASIKMAFKLFDADKKIKNQKEQLSTILHSIGDGVIATDRDGRIIQMNSVAENLTGWKFSKAEARLLDEVFCIVDANTRNLHKNPVELVLNSGKNVELSNHTVLISKNGTEYQIADSGAPIKDMNENITGVVLVFRDVTQEYDNREKIAATERAKSEILDKLNEAQNLAHIGSWDWNIKTNMVWWSDETYNIFQTGPQEFVPTFESNAIFIHPDDLEKYRKMFEHSFKTGEKLLSDIRIVTHSGKVKICNVYGQLLFDDLGDPVRFIGCIMDITERRQVEDALKESEKKMLSIIDFFPDAAFAIDREGKVIVWNHALEEMTGVMAKDILGKGNYEYALPFYGERKPILIDLVFISNDDIEKQYLFLKREGNIIVAEADISIKGGEIHSLWVKVAPLFDLDGNVIGAIEAIRDITERKKVENALHQSEERLMLSLKFNKATVFENNFETGEVISTPELYQFLGYEISEIPKTIAETTALIHPDDVKSVLDVVNAHFEGKIPEYYAEFRMRTKSGDWRWVDGRGKVIKWNDKGEPVVLLGISRDITERNLSEKQIRNLLNEKDIILKEVHHRIKNNMSTISALLRLQSKMYKNSQVENILLDAERRIKSMMVLYNKLYLSENKNEISLNEYISSLINEIKSIFPEGIEIKTYIGDFVLKSNILSSVGIIINELITNSIKYAFNESDNGIITITISKNENHVLLIYEDNGCGISNDIEFENSSGFGFRLIRMFMVQLNGSLKIEREKGTKFRIEFDIDN